MKILKENDTYLRRTENFVLLLRIFFAQLSTLPKRPRRAQFRAASLRVPAVLVLAVGGGRPLEKQSVRTRQISIARERAIFRPLEKSVIRIMTSLESVEAAGRILVYILTVRLIAPFWPLVIRRHIDYE